MSREPREFLVKYVNLQAFEKHLEAAVLSHFSEIYLIVSKDEFIRGQAVKSLTSLYLKGEKAPEFCLGSFNGETQKVEVLLKELNSLSMFAKKRLVIASNIDALDKESLQKVESYLSTLGKSICFTATATAINRATTFYKKMEKAGVILDVAEEKSWEKEKNAADFASREVVKKGKKISPDCCQDLVRQLGGDQSLISNEIEKLICYIGERGVITDVDITAICSFINADDGWQLGEAIFRRDPNSALQISKSLIIKGTALIALIRQIRFQFQTAFQICSILNSGGTPADIAKEFPYMKGQILEKNIRQAEGYGMDRFKNGILAIDKTELDAKNSAVEPDFAIERLILKLT